MLLQYRNPTALKTPSPTSEAIELNIKQAHYTAILSNESITGTMPDIDQYEFDWEIRNDLMMFLTRKRR